MAWWTPPKAGEPPLHRAARVGDHDEIRRLAAGNGDLDAVWDLGLNPIVYRVDATPLMVAAGSGDGASLATVELLLALGADPTRLVATEGVGHPKSAATFAIAGLGWGYAPGGDADRLRRLLAAGAPLPTDPEAAAWLLCRAAERGDVELVRPLLARGLDPRGSSDVEAIAAREAREREAFARYDAEHRDRFDAYPDRLRAQRAFFRELEAGERGPFWRPSFELPIVRAAASGDLACLRALVEAGADPRARDGDGRNALFFAGSEPVGRELLAYGLSLDDRDARGWSPLRIAVAEGEEGLATLRTLLALGADPNETYERGDTILICALGTDRHMATVRTLVGAGADPHVVDRSGANAFHIALEAEGEAYLDEDSVREALTYLNELGVDLERRTDAGLTPLARASGAGPTIAVSVLCELGADPNAPAALPNAMRRVGVPLELPPLFHAIRGDRIGWDERIATLLRMGADPMVEDPEGFNALGWAVASLCSESASDEYEANYKAFFAEVNAYWSSVRRSEGSRNEFAARHVPAVRAVVAAFAARLPIATEYRFASEYRESEITGLAHLCAHHAWSRAPGGNASDRDRLVLPE